VFGKCTCFGDHNRGGRKPYSKALPQGVFSIHLLKGRRRNDKSFLVEKKCARRKKRVFNEKKTQMGVFYHAIGTQSSIEDIFIIFGENIQNTERSWVGRIEQIHPPQQPERGDKKLATSRNIIEVQGTIL